MSNGFDIVLAIKSTFKAILNITIPLRIYTDSKSIYDYIVKLGTTQEKRLIVDLIYLR